MNKVIRIIISAILVTSFVASPLAGAQAQGAGPTELAPLTIGAGNTISNQYIVVLKPDASADVQAAAIGTLEASGGKILFKYDSALNGFSAILPDAALLRLRQDPQVAYIEADQIATSVKDPDKNFQESTEVMDNGLLEADSVQADPGFGLDRIDQRSKELDGYYNYQSRGLGVNVYVIDSGIRATHVEFKGRISKDFDAVGDGRNGNDCWGSGTELAGTIGGNLTGAAKSVILHSVRVQSCEGVVTLSGMIAAINWVTSKHVHPAVAVTGMLMPVSASLNTAVMAAINHGITFVADAGQTQVNACTVSPAVIPAVITVGSTNNYGIDYYGGWGRCLDIFAPGSLVKSASANRDTAYSTSGSSEAATGLVAGVAALYLQWDQTASPATVAAELIKASTKDILPGDLKGSPNRVLYSLFDTQSPIPGPVSPNIITLDNTPTFIWTTVPGAESYEYLLYKGTALQYTKSVAPGACGTETCSDSPAQVLPYTTGYAWKVRAMVAGTWKPFSLGKTFGIISPMIVALAPAGITKDNLPSFSWTKLQAASSYQLLIYKGATLIYSKILIAGICGLTTCTLNPGQVLGEGSYTWKVRPMADGAWFPYSIGKVFRISGFSSPFTTHAAGWTPLTGTWTVGGGSYRPHGDLGTELSSAHMDNYSTLTYEVKITRFGCNICDNTIFFRGSPKPLNSSGDWNNGFEYGYSTDRHFYIGYQRNGYWGWILPWTYTDLIKPGWTTLKVTMNGTFAQFFINGTRVAYGHLPMFTTGQVGVGYYNADIMTMAIFDSASLSTTAPSSSLSTEGINLDTLGPIDVATAGDHHFSPGAP
jgi:hypothetical protein